MKISKLGFNPHRRGCQTNSPRCSTVIGHQNYCCGTPGAGFACGCGSSVQRRPPHVTCTDGSCYLVYQGTSGLGVPRCRWYPKLHVSSVRGTCGRRCRILHPRPTSDTGVLRPAAIVLGVDGGRTPLQICLVASEMAIES